VWQVRAPSPGAATAHVPAKAAGVPPLRHHPSVEQNRAKTSKRFRQPVRPPQRGTLRPPRHPAATPVREGRQRPMTRAAATAAEVSATRWTAASESPQRRWRPDWARQDATRCRARLAATRRPPTLPLARPQQHGQQGSRWRAKPQQVLWRAAQAPLHEQRRVACAACLVSRGGGPLGTRTATLVWVPQQRPNSQGELPVVWTRRSSRLTDPQCWTERRPRAHGQTRKASPRKLSPRAERQSQIMRQALCRLMHWMMRALEANRPPRSRPANPPPRPPQSTRGWGRCSHGGRRAPPASRRRQTRGSHRQPR
jgi:hypothetical protein